MSDSAAEDRNWTQLFSRLDKREEFEDARRQADLKLFEEFRRDLNTTSETAAAAKTAADTAKAAAATALDVAEDARDAGLRHVAHHGLGEDGEKPSHWIANALAYATHYPQRAVLLVAVWLGVPAAFACVLIGVAGPAGGLLFLLQQSGVKTIMVPTPLPTPPAVAAPREP